MKHTLAILILLVMGHTTAQAQDARPDSTRTILPQDMVGDWKTEITPPGNAPFVFDFGISMPADSLVISAHIGGSPMTMEQVELQENRLRFVMPMHGGVSCRLTVRNGSLFAGVCVGQMGESVTTMTRVMENR